MSKPDFVIETDDELLVVDFAVVCHANKGVLKDKARDKASQYAAQKGCFDAHKTFSSQGMVFRARSMVCRETLEFETLGLEQDCRR